MVSEIAPTCYLVFGYLRCNLPRDTIDIDLKIHTLRGIHTYKRHRSSILNRYSLWNSDITPFPSLKKNDFRICKVRRSYCHPLQ